MRGRAQGIKSEQLGQALGALDPTLLEWTDDFIFDQVWGRPGLTYEERMLVAVVSLATQGQIAQLRNYFHGALQEGVPGDKLREVLLMLPVYAGFPKALDAIACLNEVLAAEAKRGG
jgi:4-carboxymuconolactone decarboxylase